MTTICTPLHKLLKKDSPWNRSSDCDKQFNKLKEMVTEAPILAHYDPEKLLILAVDTSPYGLGVVFLHTIGEDKKPIVFASHSLMPTKKIIFRSKKKD